METFDLEKLYDEKISPLISQVIEICKDNNVPMFFSACYKNDPNNPDGEMFCTTAILPENRKPQVLWEFYNYIIGHRSPSAMNITIDHGDGTKTLETIIT